MNNYSVLTIAGSDSGGGAGIQADLNTFAELGVHGCCAITSVTSQNTVSVNDVVDIPSKNVRSQIDANLEDFDIDVVKVGMLHTQDIVEEIYDALSEEDLYIVYDPVMVAESGDRLMKKKTIDLIKQKIIPLANVVTPNKFEAEEISGVEIGNEEDVKKAGIKINDLGADNTVITGGHLDGDDYLIRNRAMKTFRGQKLDVNVHGSGCVFSSAIAALIAKGEGINKSVGRAKVFTRNAIKWHKKVGHGNKPLNPNAESEKSRNRIKVLSNLREALNTLEESDFDPRLIPEVGSNLVASTIYAETIKDVAGVPGRIVVTGSDIKIVDRPIFGASRHMAVALLAYQQYDDSIKSAMNIRHNEDTDQLVEVLPQSVSRFGREDLPRGNPIANGVRYAIENSEEIPEIIVYEGDFGKEPVIMFFGESPQQVVSEVLRVSEILKQ